MTNMTDKFKPTFFESLLACFGLMSLSKHEKITLNYLNTAKDFRYEHALSAQRERLLKEELEREKALRSIAEHKFLQSQNGSLHLKSVEAV